jgi:hypothetical protein
MQIAKLLGALLFTQLSHAAGYVDPTAIDADAPEMLDPTAFYTFCGPNDFVVSLDAGKPRRSNRQVEGEESQYPLDAEGGTKTVSCKLGKQEIVATFDVNPPHERGMCAAVHRIGIKVDVDGQRLLKTKFAEYCTVWGISSLSLLSYGEGSPAAVLRVCGYWREDVPISRTKEGFAKRSFECADFDVQEMLRRKLHIVDSLRQVHALAP